MDIITSPQNQHIKMVRSLFSSKGRRTTGDLVLEGVRLIQDALEAGATFEFVLYDHSAASGLSYSLEMLKRDGVPLFPADTRVFAGVSDTVNSQGILAVVKQPGWSLKDVLNQGSEMVVLLDRIRDPGNLGTMIRTCAASGASGALLTPGTVDPYNPKCLRATMGAIFRIPVVTACDPEVVIRECQKAGFRLVVADAASEEACFDVDLTGRLCVVIGNEADGPAKLLADSANQTVGIPMPGGTESLNAASACAVILFESVRQRRKNSLLQRV